MTIKNLSDTITLANGIQMPWLGLGTWLSNEGEEVRNAVRWALNEGYRSIDTARIYNNESGIGKAIKMSGMPREDIFLTTKLWNDDQRSGRVREAFEASLKRLGVDYVDLYLIHWAVEGKYINAWKQMEEIYKSGRAKAIGVSNFLIPHLEDIIADAEIVPMVNQVEFHPRLQQPDLQEYCKKHKIQFEAWSPIMKGRIFNITELGVLAKKYGKNEVQITLRWIIQKGIVTIPKSVKLERIRSNADIFDFELEPSDMALMDTLDRNERIGSDPMNVKY